MSLLLWIMMAALGPEGQEGSKPSLLWAPPEAALEAAEAELAAAAEPPAKPQVDRGAYGPQEPRPLAPDTRRPVRPTRNDTWLYFALGPNRGGRDYAWHGLFNTPPLEEALALPEGAYHVRVGLDFATADWSSDLEGGQSRWNAAWLMETFEYDYSPMRGLLIGVRITAGELGESDGNPVAVFENGAQLVANGERSFGVASIVARGKYVFGAGFVDLGLLGEVKVPVADAEDFLTAQTVDLSLTGIATKRWGSVALHLNLGVVVPVGDPELLTGVASADPYVCAGLAFAWMPAATWSVFVQLDFNTSAFGDVTLWDETATTASVGGRVRLGGTTFLSGSVGTGFGDESGGPWASGGIDVTF